MWALIIDSRVRELFTEKPELHPSLTLVEVGADVGEGWIVNADGSVSAPSVDLEALRTARAAVLDFACATAITSGFQSDALGAVHTYPSKSTDQTNLMGSVTASLLPGLAEDWSTPFWCADGSGVWEYRAHTAAQIQTAGADGKAHVVACQSTLAALNAQLAAAPDLAAIVAIVWPSA